MKPILLAGVLLLTAGQVTHAQLSFLPQVGFEQARATLRYNELSTFGKIENFKANLKADYRFKGKHGPFINLGTSPAPISFVFNNDGQLLDSRQAFKNNLQLRIETGYQYTSKAIQLKKGKAIANTKSAPTSSSSQQKRSCGATAYRSHCTGSKSTYKSPPVNKNLNMRLQPSLAFAYLPAKNETYKQVADGFAYNATNWKTAIVPALGFEFAKGNNKLFTLTLFHTKAIGMTGKTITSYSGAKPVTTSMSSKASTWGLTAGLPISLGKKESSRLREVKQEVKPTQYRRCTRTYTQWQ